MERIERAGLTQTDLVCRRVGALEVTLLPARAYETRHVTERPRLGVAVEMQRGVDAVASDRVRTFFARPYTLSWLPTGCDVYSRSAAGGEYLMIEGDIRGARSEPCTDLAADGVREASRAVRRWLLSDRPDEDVLPAALKRLIGFVADDGAVAEHSPEELSSGRRPLVLLSRAPDASVSDGVRAPAEHGANAEAPSARWSTAHLAVTIDRYLPLRIELTRGAVWRRSR